MFDLPTSIKLNNKEYPIRNKGDFRMVEDCFLALNDIELEQEYRIATALVIFYEDFTEIEDIMQEWDENTVREAIKEMYNFFNCGEDNVGAKKPYKLIDWKNDEQLIISSINKVAYQEIRIAPYIHWWTFMGYFLNINEGLLTHIIDIREKIAKHKKLEKYEQQFRIENPQYFNWEWRTEEQIAEDNLLNEMWGRE